MAAPMFTRFINSLQYHESKEEKRCKYICYRWIQLLVGILGFLAFVAYGYYITPLYELPITLACFFISGVALINALLAVIKLVSAYRIKRRNSVPARSVNELNLETDAGDPTECNRVPGTTTTDDEVENLREMLRQALSSHRPKTELHSKNLPQSQRVGHRITLSPSNSVENWSNPRWNGHEFPSRKRLQRTESFESSLKFHPSYKSRYTSSCNGSFCSSSSEHETYIYPSSSDGGNSSRYCWKKNLERVPPIGNVTMTKPNRQISQINRNIEQFRLERDQFTQRLPSNLPEEFPALPFPKRNYEIEKSGKRHPEFPKRFKSLTRKETSTIDSLVRSRSLINIDRFQRLSRRDILKILARLSPMISVEKPPNLKCSRKRLCRKHTVPKNMII